MIRFSWLAFASKAAVHKLTRVLLLSFGGVGQADVHQMGGQPKWGSSRFVFQAERDEVGTA